MNAKKKSRRYGKRFSSPYSKWPTGHRRNRFRKKGAQRRKGKSIVIVGK